ncbi:MAG: NUDIX hydrolase [Deltaproteobacteria bacterium]|nr:NUDIX hydrolase [Deltaproteobacteria bacterium]
MTAPKQPRLAATVILLRPAEAQGFEVFLTRRPDSMPFLGGMYCFPGGTLHKEDSSEAMLRRCRGVTPTQARDILGARFRPRDALGLWVACVRELFEETGVLLGCQEGGKVIEEARIAALHDALMNEALSFLALLEREELNCDLGRLAYFSCWQTPSQFPVRFDTRFFIATLPANQTPLATSPEVAHSLWITPDEALQLFKRGELPMIFPTFASLRTLADFAGLESLQKEYLQVP